jgi:hypothetical protein
VLGHGGRQVQRALQADRGRHRLADQRAQRVGADRGQHGGDGVLVGADVAGDEFVALFEVGRRDARGVRAWAAIRAWA